MENVECPADDSVILKRVMPNEGRMTRRPVCANYVQALVFAVAVLSVSFVWGAQVGAGGDTNFVTIGRAKAHPTRILAKFKESIPVSLTEDQKKQFASRIIRRSKLDSRQVVLDELPGALPPVGAAEEARRNRLLHRIQLLEASGLFEYVEPDYAAEIFLEPNDAAFANGWLWGLRNVGQFGGVAGADISATNAWNISTGSTNVVVAVIDTGIRYTHQDLATQMWRNPGEIPGNNVDDDGNGYVDDVFGINAITGSGDPLDDHGHGTHCAGTIGAAANNGYPHVGVAWRVRLMACKFLSAYGGGTYSDAIECIDYAVSKGAKILNNSWGGYGYSRALYEAIDRARVNGVLFVAAAGNESLNNDITPAYPASYPLENIISVAAIDRRDRLASFSNYGLKTVHLGAPGVEIYSSTADSDSSYEVWDGTSMATPHVVGVAALILSRYPGADLEELQARILLGTVPTAALQGRTTTGGRLNAYNSLAMTGRGPVLYITVDPPTKSFLLGGSQQPIFVKVKDPFSVVNATVTATVVGITNLVFANDGRYPDAVASDAIYSALFRVPNLTNYPVQMVLVVTAPEKIPLTNVLEYMIVPPPPNDHFTNSIKVPLAGATYQFNNRFASLEPGEPAHAGIVTSAGSLWWDYTPANNTNVFVDTTGSGVDTIVAVYTGNSLIGLQPVAAVNDVGQKKQAYLSFNAQAGQTYRIAVASNGTNMLGSIQTRIAPGGEPDTVPPAVFVTTPPNGYSVIGNVVSVVGTAVDPPPNVSGLQEVKISVNGNLPYTATGTTNWSALAVLREGVNVIQVRAFDAAGNCSPDVTLQVYCIVLNPVNDLFANAIVLTNSSGSMAITNVNATKEVGEPNHAGNLGGKSVWWSFTAPADGILQLSTSNSTFDTVLAVYTGDRVDSLAFVCANDDAYDGVRWSRVTHAVRSNQTYRIAVDGYDGASGTVRLSWSFTESPVCSLAVSSTPGGVVNVAVGTTILPQIIDVPSNTTALLAAVPDAGYLFDGWTGDVLLFNNPLNLLVNRDLNLTAQFQPVQFTDGFESGDLRQLGWTTTGAKPWIVQSTNVATGQFAARSGTITDSQTSSLFLTARVRGGTGSFAYYVSSEVGFDFLEFYVDGLLSSRWSGEVGWATYEFPLTPGTHTFEWRYTKDTSGSVGLDAAFIDNVMLPVVVEPDSTARARLTINRTTDGVFYIEGFGQANQSYITQVSTNLVTWQNITTNVALGGFFRVVDYSSLTNQTRFYRAIVPVE